MDKFIPEDKIIVKFRLNFDEDMKLSMNKVWSWGPWTQWVRKKAADLWHEDITTYLESKRIKPIKEKVNFFFEFAFSTWGTWWRARQLDSSNCSAMGKMVEDALKYDKKKNPKWIIQDDTSEFVGWFNLHSINLSLQERQDLDSSYVDVTICSQ